MLGTDVFRLPFRFPLPDGLPPSFHFHAWEINIYVIGITGILPGIFKASRKNHKPIVVLPKDEASVGMRMGLGGG